jgi:hypothetical protein
VGGFSHLQQVGIISLQREIDGYNVPSTYITKISPNGKKNCYFVISICLDLAIAITFHIEKISNLGLPW